MPARQPDSFCHPPLLWAPAWAKPWQPDQHHFNNFIDFTALPSQNPFSPALPYCQPFSWAKPRPCLGQALAFPNQPFHHPTRPPSSLRQVSRACWPGPSPCHFLENPTHKQARQAKEGATHTERGRATEKGGERTRKKAREREGERASERQRQRQRRIQIQRQRDIAPGQRTKDRPKKRKSDRDKDRKRKEKERQKER